jgi:hypothetical protein
MKIKGKVLNSFIFALDKDGETLIDAPDMCIAVAQKLFPWLNNGDHIVATISRRKLKNAVFVEHVDHNKVVINAKTYTITSYTKAFLNKHNLSKFWLKLEKDKQPSHL